MTTTETTETVEGQLVYSELRAVDLASTEARSSGLGGEIYPAMIAAVKAMKGVGKDGYNKAQGFNFRSVDDIAAAAKAVFEQVGIFVVPHMRLIEGIPQPDRGYRAVIEAGYTFYASDGSWVHAQTIGEGVDSYDKATNKAMAAAFKYVLMQSLCIADPSDDADAHSEPQEQPQQAAPAPPPVDESTLEVTTEQWKEWEAIRPTLLDNGEKQRRLVEWLTGNDLKVDRSMSAAAFAALMAQAQELGKGGAS